MTEPTPSEDLDDLLARRKAMLARLSDRLASPPAGATCLRCAEGKHDKCTTDVWQDLARKRVPCTCPLREVEGHP